MKLLIASNFYELTHELEDQLTRSGISGENITIVNTVDAVLKELKTDTYHFVISEYAIEGATIWQLAKLINSSQLSPHSIPLYLIKESCEVDIPLLLAKEHDFTIVALQELLPTIASAYTKQQLTGYVRGKRQSAKHTLLLIEDDEDAVLAAQYALQDQYDIDVARNGLTGLELWLAKRHELVLLDLMLPVMNGDQVLEKIMAVDENQPVIIVTGHDRPNNHKDLLLNGASEYLCKPFAMTTLIEQCQMILIRARLIYQAHYTQMKLKALRNLIWALDQSLAKKDARTTQRVMNAIKTLLPGKPTEDEQMLINDSEF